MRTSVTVCSIQVVVPGKTRAVTRCDLIALPVLRQKLVFCTDGLNSPASALTETNIFYRWT